MSFESDTIDRLRTDTDLTALLPAASITFGTAPQNPSSPFVVCFRINTAPTLSTDNGASGASRLDNVQLQVTCYGRGYADALAIAEQVRLRLEATATTKYILRDQRGDYDDLPDLHGQIMVFSCWYQGNS
jgi:hypothetical protein